MKITPIIIAFAIGIASSLFYMHRETAQLPPSIAIICTIAGQPMPSYLAPIEHKIVLSDTFPAVTQKAMKGTVLSDCLNNESLYKITSLSDFNPGNKESCIVLSELDRNSGFIHASFGQQVQPIISKFFKDSSQILIIELNKNKLAQQGIILKSEQNKPGGEFFPHLHGKQQINLAIVQSSIELVKQADGTWLASCIALYHWNSSETLTARKNMPTSQSVRPE